MAKTLKCLECGEKIVIDEYVEVGDVIFCDECGVGLVVKSLKPLKVEIEEEIDDFLDEDEDDEF